MQVRAIRRVLALACGGALALTLAGSAPSAAPTPAGQLVVMPIAASVGGGVALDVYSSANAPAPARVTIYVPAGFGVTTTAAPGTLLGDAYLDFTSAGSPDGEFTFGTVAARSPGSTQACDPGAHAAVWVASFSVGTPQRDVEIPFSVDPTVGGEAALGAFKLVACPPSPYVPEDQGGAPDRLRVLELVLGLSEPGRSVITKPSKGDYIWRLVVTPYARGTASPDPAATFEARARTVLPHVMTERVRYLRKTRTVLVTGRVLLLGKPERGLLISVAGGSPKASFLDYFGQTRTRAGGFYSLREHVAPLRRARKLRVYVFGNEARRAGCVEDPTVAPAGCVDQSFSPPQSRSADVVVPRKA